MKVKKIGPRTVSAPALWKAVASSSTKEVERLLVDGAVIDERGGRSGCTPLHQAARGGRPSLILLLIQYGANVLAKDRTGETALHYAVRLGFQAVALHLLEHGAKVSAKENEGWTALHYSVRSGWQTLSLLLLEHGAVVSPKDHDGWTPLHWAAFQANDELALLLVERGADTTAENNDGETPTMERLWSSPERSRSDAATRRRAEPDTERADAASTRSRPIDSQSEERDRTVIALRPRMPSSRGKTKGGEAGAGGGEGGGGVDVKAASDQSEGLESGCQLLKPELSHSNWCHQSGETGSVFAEKLTCLYHTPSMSTRK